MGGKGSKQVIKIQFERSELADIKEAFDMFDEDGDGHITISELNKIMRQLNVSIKDNELQRIMDHVDLDSSGRIDFGEFLIMMKNFKERRNREKEIREMFAVLDVRHKGKISADDLKIALENIGMACTDNDIEEMMGEADRNLDGYIDFQEFHALCYRLDL